MDTREKLKDLIAQKVLIRPYWKDEQDDLEGSDGWIFDFRRVILVPNHLELLIDVLYAEICERDGLQIGGLESAAIPLVTGLVLRAHRDGKRVNGFYVRKSRKKSGLYRVVEGELNNDPIVLVDDLMNSAGSFERQIAVLEAEGRRVTTVLSVVRFRDLSAYKHLIDKGIEPRSLFTIDEFGLTYTAKKLTPEFDQRAYRTLWTQQPQAVSHFLVAARSTPVVYGDTVLFASNDGYIHSYDSRTGDVLWRFRTGHSSQGKSILSSPVINEATVFFGSYDGKFYALDAGSGRPRWVFTECEWVGSSPAVNGATGTVFVGLEHAHPTRKGSLVALDVETGVRRWEYPMSALTHASPLVLSAHNQVAIGGNEGVLSLLNAATGEILWRFETEGGGEYEGIGGFSPGDIKLAPVYDHDTDTIAFSSMDGCVYVLQRATGDLVYRVETEYLDTGVRAGVVSSPVVSNGHLVFGALDKRVYCCDLATGVVKWKYRTSGRIFAAPVVRGGLVYIGSNDAAIHEIVLESGVLRGRRQFAERITAPVVFHDLEDRTVMYVTTNTSQIFTVEPYL